MPVPVLLSDVLDEILRLKTDILTVAREQSLENSLPAMLLVGGIDLTANTLERRFAAPAQPPSKEGPKS